MIEGYGRGGRERWGGRGEVVDRCMDRKRGEEKERVRETIQMQGRRRVTREAEERRAQSRETRRRWGGNGRADEGKGRRGKEEELRLVLSFQLGAESYKGVKV